MWRTTDAAAGVGIELEVDGEENESGRDDPTSEEGQSEDFLIF